MLINEPKTHTGKKPLVYYSVRGWSDSETLADSIDFYEYAGEAIARAHWLIKAGFCSAVVREEFVYRRTSKGELSSSTPILIL